MLELQKYLLAGNSVESLTEKYAILIKRHPQFPNLILFKYHMIDSPMNEKICQEARGIILDEASDYKVVNMSFMKFFNVGEGNAAKIDWSTAKIYQKIDGSLMQLYYYMGQWHVASSGMPAAEGVVQGFDFTFAELFWKTWNQLGYVLPKETDKCYYFELTSKYNRVVVKYLDEQLTLLGVRDLNTLQELEPESIALLNNWKCVKTYSFSNLEEILEVCKTMEGIKEEGFVVRDSNFNRIKIKSVQYVALSHLKDTMSQKRMAEIVRANETSEFLSYFPEFTDLYNEIKERYHVIVKNLEEAYEKYKGIEEQKQFALSINKIPGYGILFGMRKGQYTSVKDALSKMLLSPYLRLLGLKD